ncbi:MAG: hypothetical protein ACKVHP_24545, partial [Verrucomicrobiales bacterium]
MKSTRLLLTTATLLLYPLAAAIAEDKPKEEKEAAEEQVVEVSVFPDKAFENAVRKQVFAKRDSDAPLTADDVRNISIIHGNKMGIKSLEGVQHCVSVAEIRLAENEIEDLNPLRDLKRLQSLSLE